VAATAARADRYRAILRWVHACSCPHRRGWLARNGRSWIIVAIADHDAGAAKSLARTWLCCDDAHGALPAYARAWER
jgi:hypothetical protein